ncbi:uncharacterized protein LOC108042831 [Drosophila rhopaloa]|uniref:Uncharacterized protein LOC108042831 n=1 Tax=Drosophila rhopaloa TaxID=1041015 RepID=A0A6P4EP40_DRORH|nr:uncharacterized protein LOC108042831 [Drosophila rhopaloa]
MVILTPLLLLACATGFSHSMLYKLNPEEKYEADLVPVSSTVIPLTVLEVSYGAGGKPSEEYKAAYLRKLRKQVLQRADKDRQADEDDEVPTVLGLSDSQAPAPTDADALITVKSQQLEKAKVKAV